jgi:glycosyltransferase 2 family protein
VAKGKKNWGMLILRVLGVLLLVYVFSNVNWRDTVQLVDGAELVGRIQGEVPAEWTPGGTIDFVTPEDPSGRTLRLDQIEVEMVGDTKVPVVNEGILRIVRRSNALFIFLGILVFGLTSHFGVWRWWLLLRSQGIRLSFWVTHKLTFLGLFFNNVVPGATGGDLVKAVYVARHTEGGARSVATVLIDRITGVVALATIAAAALLTQLDNPDYRQAAYVIFGFLGAFAVGCVLFFSRRIRRVLHVDEIAAKLPGGGMLKQFDEACFAYRDHKSTVVWALLLSFGNQLCIQLIMVLFAHAMNVTTRAGEAVPIADYLVILPVGFMLAAIPALPGGWGVREGAFALFFHQVGVGRNEAVALSVLAGLMMMAWSLLGGVYFLLWRASGEDLSAQEEVGPEADPPD